MIKNVIVKGGKMFKQMQVRKLVSDEAERTGKLLADMEMRARRLPIVV